MATWNLSVQEEELRGGPGNPLLASTFHDQTLEISFTDALISTDLIGAMIGATGTSTGRTDTQGVFMFTEEVTYASGGSLTMTKNASQFAPKHSTSTAQALKYTGWYRKEGETEWSIGIITNGVSPATGTMAPSGSASLTAGKYCVKYMIDTAQSGDTTFNLNADFVPSVLHAISYIDVYEAGNAGCGATEGGMTGRSLGQLVIL